MRSLKSLWTLNEYYGLVYAGMWSAEGGWENATKRHSFRRIQDPLKCLVAPSFGTRSFKIDILCHLEDAKDYPYVFLMM